jgi:hypothetical protein
MRRRLGSATQTGLTKAARLYRRLLRRTPGASPWDITEHSPVEGLPDVELSRIRLSIPLSDVLPRLSYGQLRTEGKDESPAG